MDKRLIDLLDKIEAAKSEVVALVDADKVEEAQAKKEELKALQNKYDLLEDTITTKEDETVEVKDTKLPVEDKRDAVAEFANAARKGFRNINNETTPADGGYTVPVDIQTKINEWREADASLQSLVATEKVTTLSGARTYKSRSKHTGFSKVGEGAKIGKIDGPGFERIEYSVSKYAGYLPVTNELLADSDANISNTLIEWLGKEDVATRNNLILDVINADFAATEIADLDAIKKVINVTLGAAYKGLVRIVTNDTGLNYLDTLKDNNGRYILSPDVVNPMQMHVAVGALRIPITVIPDAVLKNTDDGAGKSKVPFLIGSFTDAIKVYDRQQITIATSKEAATTDFNAFEEDLTLFRAIERLDVKSIDKQALFNGYMLLGN